MIVRPVPLIVPPLQVEAPVAVSVPPPLNVPLLVRLSVVASAVPLTLAVPLLIERLLTCADPLMFAVPLMMVMVPGVSVPPNVEIPPDTCTVPVILGVVPVRSLVVPKEWVPFRSRTLLALSVKSPVWVPPPARLKVPACTVTVPVMSFWNGTNKLKVAAPVPCLMNAP